MNKSCVEEFYFAVQSAYASRDWDTVADLKKSLEDYMTWFDCNSEKAGFVSPDDEGDDCDETDHMDNTENEDEEKSENSENSESGKKKCCF